LYAEPVVITLPEDGSHEIGVAPASARHVDNAIPEAYRNSTIVTKAAQASRLIIASSEYVAKTLETGAEHFTHTTKPNAKPMTFTPTAKENIRRVHSFSSGAAGMSSKVVGHVSKYAQDIGAALLKHTNSDDKGPDGKPREPGLLNKSMMAFSTISSSVDQAGRGLLASGTSAATKVVTHRYGEEAGEISQTLEGSIKNVALVYIDVTGVSRKAIVKSLAKGMVVGKVGEKSLIIPGTEEPVPVVSTTPTPPPPGVGVVPTVGRVPSALDKPKQPKPKNWKEKEAAEGRYTDDASMTSGRKGSSGSVADGRVPDPPVYGSGVGEIIDETKFSGDSKDPWR
jgi:spartin